VKATDRFFVRPVKAGAGKYLFGMEGIFPQNMVVRGHGPLLQRNVGL
jgi:hypothetical protein